jgi:hypothetical protein
MTLVSNQIVCGSCQTVSRNSRSHDEQWKMWTSVSGPRASVRSRCMVRPHAQSGGSVEPGFGRCSNIVALEFRELALRGVPQSPRRKRPTPTRNEHGVSQERAQEENPPLSERFAPTAREGDKCATRGDEPGNSRGRDRTRHGKRLRATKPDLLEIAEVRGG